MRFLAVPVSRARPGVTLLEVLIAMFILTVGLLSVFGLFTAGRELSARAEIRGRALAYAASQGSSLADAWGDVRQWQHHDGTNFKWVRWDGNDWNPRVRLPVLVDPWGLCSDWDRPGGSPAAWDTNMSSAVLWNWNQAVPLISALAGEVFPRPFPRITLPAIPGTLPRPQTSAPSDYDAQGDVGNIEMPLAREQTNAIFADPDAIEYQTVQNDPNAIPLNLFELGRRKRGTDLVPALFIAASDGSSGRLNSTAPMKRTLLIFHKPTPDYEQDADGRKWPTGSLEFVALQVDNDLVSLQLTRVPSEDTAIRRSLRPGNWLLFTRRRGPTAGYYDYDACWRRMTSVTPEGTSASPWLVVLSQDLPIAWPRTPNDNWDPDSPVTGGPRSHLRRNWTQPPAVTDSRKFGTICAYAFESLVHVESLPDAKLLNAQ
jgi:prepilin-type N-terminal cleavage/methylation domain-containing protein